MKYHQNISKKYFANSKESLERGFITYTCTNHPEVILNEPGVCPECGKELVKKYS